MSSLKRSGYFLPVEEVDEDVSENSGTPKSSILIGFSIKIHPFWGTPIFGNTHEWKLHFGFATLRVEWVFGWGEEMFVVFWARCYLHLVLIGELVEDLNILRGFCPSHEPLQVEIFMFIQFKKQTFMVRMAICLELHFFDSSSKETVQFKTKRPSCLSSHSFPCGVLWIVCCPTFHLKVDNL